MISIDIASEYTKQTMLEVSILPQNILNLTNHVRSIDIASEYTKQTLWEVSASEYTKQTMW